MKYLTLPTWLLLKLLISGIPEHPYATWYPTLDEWASKSLVLFRLIDLSLFLIASTCLCNLPHLFF